MINVKREFTNRFPSPYSNCNDLTSYSSDLNDFIIESGRIYRQKDCLDLCIQKRIIKECKCFNLKYLPLNNRTKPCFDPIELNCTYIQESTINYGACVRESCPLECNTITYESKLYSYPKVGVFNDYISLSKENISYYERTFLKNRTLTYALYQLITNEYDFKVFYSNLEYSVITESPKVSLSDLLAQIGGSLGMFVSFSVFTLFEFLEIFILIVYSALFKSTTV